jgi:GT2 family glycosyltransferase
VSTPEVRELSVLIASYNRRETTLTCLRSLAQQPAPGHHLTVRLLDAGSTDDTVDAVRREFPHTRIIVAPGMYWARSMVTLADVAIAGGADVLLFLNDDVRLRAGAIAELLEWMSDDEASPGTTRAGRVLAVGATVDPADGVVGYGGMRRSRWLRRLELVGESSTSELCDSANFNIAMLSATSYRSVGGLSRSFEHAKADWDFGLRLTARGGRVVQVPGVLGECTVGGSRQTWLEPGLPLGERLHRMHQPKGAPLRESVQFAFRHYGVIRGAASVAMIYVRLLGAQAGLRVQR